MTYDHWFDSLNRLLVRPAPRRATLRSAAALVFAALLVVRHPIAVGAVRERCARRACRRHPWPQTTEEADRNFCEIKCGRCKKTGTAFCIHRADNHHDTDHATCCRRDEKCCQDTFYCCPAEYRCCKDPSKPFPCCPPGRDCCSGDPDGCCGEGEECCDTRDVGEACVPRGSCCPDDTETGWCGSDQTCCPGVGCVAGDECGNACPPGPNYQPCPDGYRCCEGGITGPGGCYDPSTHQCCPGTGFRCGKHRRCCWIDGRFVGCPLPEECP
jgi:hypothetical protein